jgi:hypothetical protein
MSPEESKARWTEKEALSTEEGKDGQEETTGVDHTRRALIRAGWVLPVVLALQLQIQQPSTAFAQYGHSDHSDHSDAGHVDHGDVGHDDHSDIMNP